MDAFLPSILFFFFIYSQISIAETSTSAARSALSDSVMKLGDFDHIRKRKLLYFDTTCYSGCDSNCNTDCDTCDDDCNTNCNICYGGCNTDCDDGCNYSCDDSCAWGCDSGCDKGCGSGCDGGCTTNCNQGCAGDCNAGCDRDCNGSCNQDCDEDCIDYFPQCDVISHNLVVNWDNLSASSSTSTQNGSNSANDPGSTEVQTSEEINVSLEATPGADDDLGLVLTVTAVADYKVYATMSQIVDEFGVSNFGFTYVLDTFEFGNSLSGPQTRSELRDANACENRMYRSFVNNVTGGDKLFSEYWEYTLFPSDPSQLGNNLYLQYPDPNGWTLQMHDPYHNPCGQVQWQRTFTISELVNTCGGFEWINNEASGTVDLVGSFYLTALSPDLSRSSQFIDNGAYLSQTLAQVPVEISLTTSESLSNSAVWAPGPLLVSSNVSNQSNASSRTNSFESKVLIITEKLQNFGCEFVRIDVTDNFTVAVDFLTSVPAWMRLKSDSDSEQILEPTKAKIEALGISYESLVLTQLDQNYTDRYCVVLDSFRCWQRWQVTFVLSTMRMEARGLLTAQLTNLVDLSTNYTLQFSWECTQNSEQSVYDFCSRFYENNNVFGLKSITFNTQTVQQKISTNTITSESSDSLVMFFEDESFEMRKKIKTDPASAGEVVFVHIELEHPSQITGISLANVFLCYGSVSSEDNDNYTTPDVGLKVEAEPNCLEQDRNVFEIHLLFDVLSDSALFEPTLLSQGSNWLRFSFRMLNISDEVLVENDVEDLASFFLTSTFVATLGDGQTVLLFATNSHLPVSTEAPTMIPSWIPSSMPSLAPISSIFPRPSSMPIFFSIEFLANPTAMPSNLAEDSETRDGMISNLSDTESIIVIVTICVAALCLTCVLFLFIFYRRANKDKEGAREPKQSAGDNDHVPPKTIARSASAVLADIQMTQKARPETQSGPDVIEKQDSVDIVFAEKEGDLTVTANVIDKNNALRRIRSGSEDLDVLYDDPQTNVDTKDTGTQGGLSAALELAKNEEPVQVHAQTNGSAEQGEVSPNVGEISGEDNEKEAVQPVAEGQTPEL